jgi:hypothetical protein
LSQIKIIRGGGGLGEGVPGGDGQESLSAAGTILAFAGSFADAG